MESDIQQLIQSFLKQSIFYVVIQILFSVFIEQAKIQYVYEITYYVLEL